MRRWSVVLENDWQHSKTGYTLVEFVQLRLIRTPDDTTVTLRLFGLGVSVTRWADHDEWPTAAAGLVA